MKPYLCIASLLFAAGFCAAMTPAQQIDEVVIISEKVGEVIDFSERNRFHLFQNVDGFVKATFFRSSDTAYYAQIISYESNGERRETKRAYSLLALLRMAEIINHFDEVSAGGYIVGTNPATIRVLGGPTIGWPPSHEPVTAKGSTAPQEYDESGPGIEVPPYFEIRISGGYGFPKGGNPMTSYDETVAMSSGPNGSSSSDAVNNVDDEYPTAGQGVRYELGCLYYFRKGCALFLETGYSSGSQGTQTSRLSIESGYYQTSSQSRSEDHQTFNFSYVPVCLGLHLRTGDGPVHPYAGVGAGLFVPYKLTMGSSYTNGSYSSEQEVKVTANTPVGYIGYLGLSFSLGAATSLFVEAKATLVSFYVSKTELTKAVVNGQDMLPGIPAYERITTYAEDENYIVSGASDPNSTARGGAPPALVANSIGITFGFSFGL